MAGLGSSQRHVSSEHAGLVNSQLHVVPSASAHGHELHDAISGVLAAVPRLRGGEHKSIVDRLRGAAIASLVAPQGLHECITDGTKKRGWNHLGG